MPAAAPPLRLVHVITSLKLGGAQMHLYRTVSRFNPEKIASVVISLASGGKISRLLRDAGIPVYEVGLQPGDLDHPERKPGT